MLFDVMKMKDAIITAAWESRCRNVSIDSKYLDGVVGEPTLYVSSDGIVDTVKTRKIFMDTIRPYVNVDCSLFVIVVPRERVLEAGDVVLISGSEWVYG